MRMCMCVGSLTVLCIREPGVYVYVWESLTILWIREPGVYVYVYVWERPGTFALACYL